MVGGMYDYAQAVVNGEIPMPDFGDLTQVTGTIEDKPALPPECHNDEPVNAELAWRELQRSCRGG